MLCDRPRLAHRKCHLRTRIRDLAKGIFEKTRPATASMKSGGCAAVSEEFVGDVRGSRSGNPDKRLVTVWGSSNAINVNTASPQTLLMLVCTWLKKDRGSATIPLKFKSF